MPHAQVPDEKIVPKFGERLFDSLMGKWIWIKRVNDDGSLEYQCETPYLQTRPRPGGLVFGGTLTADGTSYLRREQPAARPAAAQEAVAVVQRLSVAGTPMPDSTGIDWLKPVPAGAKLYLHAPAAPVEQKIIRCKTCHVVIYDDAAKTGYCADHEPPAPAGETAELVGRDDMPPDDGMVGLYRKYDVRRLNDTTGKHANCEYYVLDMMHDKFAADALEAYCRACTQEFPSLAVDLYGKASKIRVQHNHFGPTNQAEINQLRSQNAELEAAVARLSAASGEEL